MRLISVIESLDATLDSAENRCIRISWHFRMRRVDSAARYTLERAPKLANHKFGFEHAVPVSKIF